MKMIKYFAFIVIVSGIAGVSAVQAQLVWTGGVNNAWNASDTNWLNGGTPTTFADGDNVVFNDASTQTNIDITASVNPGVVIFGNSTNRTYWFTNTTLGGSAALLKTNNGVVNFGSATQNGFVNTVPFPFTGGVGVSQGTVRVYVKTNGSTYTYAAGGGSFGFGTDSITLNGTNASLAFAGGYGVTNAALVLTNKIIAYAGTVDVSRANTSIGAMQQNLGGDIDLYGSLVIGGMNGVLGAVLSNTAIRVMGGTTTVYGNPATLTLGGSTTNPGTYVAYEQNITGGAKALNIIGTDLGMVKITGNNTGLTGGITLQPHTVSSCPIIFTGTNTLSGGSITVNSGAYAGLSFDFTATTINGLTWNAGSVLGIDSNSAVNIDLSAKDIWLGSALGATYTGTLTPYGSTYKFCGGGAAGGLPLVLSLANTLTGGNALQLGDATSYQQPGALVLTASNSFTGGTTLTCTRNGQPNARFAPTLYIRAAGALGTGPVTINTSTSTVQPVLQFETSPYSNAVANDIIITGAVGYASINANVPTWLNGSLLLYPTNTFLGFDAPAANNGAPSLLVINPGPGKTVNIASKCGILCGNNWRLLVDFTTGNNIPSNAAINASGCGGIVLSPGFTWSNLVSGRTFSGSSNLKGPLWRGSSFAARGTTQIIDSVGAFLNDQANSGTNNWMMNGTAYIGSPLTNADGSFYCNAPIKVTRDVALGAVFAASTGAGITNQTATGMYNEFSGTISGSGALIVGGNGPANVGRLGELLLSGTSIWTNGVVIDISQTGSNQFMTGPGGMAIHASNYGLARFKGNASLPSGNGGSNAYVAAITKVASDSLYGYLLTGSTNNQVYSLTNNMKFIIGGANAGLIGVADGQATLTNSTIAVSPTTTDVAKSLYLLVRDTNSMFTLGSASGAVTFYGCYYQSGNNLTGYGLTNGPATTIIDRTTVTTLIKRGPGPLFLNNVLYTKVDGTGNIATNFIWQLGSGTVGLDDGVVRETGTATNNSTRTQNVYLNGGVMGLVADYPVKIGTSNAQVNLSGAAGGGFAAYGSNCTVTLVPSGSTNSLGWGSTTATAPDFFMNAAAPMILSAKDADSSIILASAPTNYIRLVTSNINYTITVLDNPATNTDTAVLAIRLSSVTNLFGVTTLTKNGAGTLVLTATNNDYQASTLVSNGTLIINGNLLSNKVAAASNVVVCSGATLGGTGTIARTVSVLSGGTLAAGAGPNQVGTLTISNLVLNSGSTVSVDVGGSSAGQYDVIAVGGNSAVTLNNVSLVMTSLNGYDIPAGGSIPIMTAPGGFTGTFTTVSPHGYSVRFDELRQILSLHRDSAGFIIRIQ